MKNVFFPKKQLLNIIILEIRWVLNGLVHPKMKIKSLITHPHAVPTPVRPLLVFGTQMKIFLIQFERWITTT